MEDRQVHKLLQRSRVKGLLKRFFWLILFTTLIYYALGLVYATKTIYKVRRNYAVILEDLSGQRRVVKEVGWHMRPPIFSRLELEVPLMNQPLYLGGKQQPERIISRGNVALWTSAMMTWRIVDLERWGIENQHPLQLLQNDFDGIVKDVMQSRRVDDLISEREQIKKQIFVALKARGINEGGPTLEQKYGIEVVSFVLKDTRYGDKLVEASEEKKRRELIAEAENYAADQEASRIRKLYQAYRESVGAFRTELGMGAEGDAILMDFLNQQKWAAAYEKNLKGQNTFVLNNAKGAMPVVLPAPEGGAGTGEHSDGRGAKNQKSGVRQALGAANPAD